MELQRTVDTRKGAAPERGLMCKVEIDCMTIGQVIPGGTVVPLGKHVATVFAADLAVVKAMAFTDEEAEWYARAEEAYKRNLARAIELATADIADAEAKALMREKTIAQHTDSLPSTYRRIYGVDPKPFRSVRVVAENLPAPVDYERRERETEVATVVAEVVKQVMGGQGQQKRNG